MFSKQKPTSNKKKWLYVALVGAACLVGTVLYGSFKPAEDFDSDVASRFIESIQNHHAYTIKQIEAIDKLIIAGNERSVDTVNSIKAHLGGLVNFASTRSAQTTKDNLTKGSDSLKKNVEWG